jgi:hypothetical protein
MIFPAYVTAPDSTLPQAPIPWWMWSVFILAVLCIVLGTLAYFFYGRWHFSRLRELLSSAKMHAELNQGYENELDSLRLELAEKNLRVEILEKELQREEVRRNVIERFLRKVIFSIIPNLTTIDQTDRLKGTFQEFRGDSMFPFDIGADVEIALKEREDTIIDTTLYKKKPNGNEDPE